MAIEDEEDFFQNDFYENEEGSEWEEMLEPQKTQGFTNIINSASDTTLIEMHSRDTSQSHFGKVLRKTNILQTRCTCIMIK